MSSNTHLEELFDDIKEGALEAIECLDSMSMYRVPDAIRNLRKSAYTPRLVSIGPLHSHESHLQPMQPIKMNYVHSLLHRLSQTAYLGEGGDRKALGDCFDLMKNELKDAKKHYGSDVRDKLNERMLVIDGCFILELLFVHYCIKNKIDLPPVPVPVPVPEGTHAHLRCRRVRRMATESKRGDPVFGSSALTRHTVLQDLLLLENQLPFSVLHYLFENTLKKLPEANQRYRVPPLRELIIQCFGDLLSPKYDAEKKGNSHINIFVLRKLFNPCFGSLMNPVQKGDPTPPAAGEENKGGENPQISISVPHDDGHQQEPKDEHILQLLHRHYCHLGEQYDKHPSSGETNQKGDHTEFVYSALDLDHAGVKFVADKTIDSPLNEARFHQPEGYFEWWFRRATFRIPTFCIDDATEVLFRNLIAFEQCTPDVPQYFTSYAFLLDKLINTEKDVQVLQKAGVVRHCLGSNQEASELVNKLCSEVGLGKFHFQEACGEVADYVANGWPNFRAQLMRNYFSTPWTFVAFCLAFLTFGIQITNFVRSFTG